MYTARVMQYVISVPFFLIVGISPFLVTLGFVTGPIEFTALLRTVGSFASTAPGARELVANNTDVLHAYNATEKKRRRRMFDRTLCEQYID